MRKLASFIAKRRNLILAIMLLITAVCALFVQNVSINSDMTKYLPSDSSMKTGIDIMESEFPDTEDTYTIRVMFENLEEAEKPKIDAELSGMENVESVSWEPDDPAYSTGEYTLYVLTTKYGYDTAEEAQIESDVAAQYADRQVVVKNNDDSRSGIPPFVLVIALTILMTILFISCDSFMEPFIFLATIGVAIVINSGTNYILGEVSEITSGIAAILQLVLSMDYSIILMSRFRQELTRHDSRKDAMVAALAGAFSSIASSAFTTIVGLLMLVFMSFTIGADLGVVLAKGVLCSLICVFLVLPSLILLFDKAIRKTTKRKKVKTVQRRNPLDVLGAFEARHNKAISVFFVVLFAGAYFLQTTTRIAYTLSETDPIADVFPADNQIVLVYENGDDAAVTKLAESLSDDAVRSVSSYSTTLGKQYSAAELADSLPNMDGGIDISPEMLNTIFYDYYRGDEQIALTLDELGRFISEDVTNSDALSGSFDVGALSGIGSLQSIPDASAGEKAYTSTELAEIVSDMAGEKIDESKLQLLYLYYGGIKLSDPSWTLSIDELIHFLSDDLLNDARFADMIDDETRVEVADAATKADDGIAQLRGNENSRLIITTSLPAESQETTDFIAGLDSRCKAELSGEYHLVGNSVMVYEMESTFNGELLLITLLTALAIFAVVALAFRSFVIPLILVLIVQCGVFITVSVIGLQGSSIYYLALLIVECILMGATIDYGILFTTYFRTMRKTLDLKEALCAAYRGSIHTILTSGSIMVFVTAIVGRFFGNATIEQIVSTVSIGCFSAIVLILFILPGILATFDRFIVRTRNKA